jgi:hypothetical protein
MLTCLVGRRKLLSSHHPYNKNTGEMYGKKSAASSHKANDKYMEDFEEAYQALSVKSSVKSGGAAPPAPPPKSIEGATSNVESLLPNPILACDRKQLDISPSFKVLLLLLWFGSTQYIPLLLSCTTMMKQYRIINNINVYTAHSEDR